MAEVERIFLLSHLKRNENFVAAPVYQEQSTLFCDVTITWRYGGSLHTTKKTFKWDSTNLKAKVLPSGVHVPSRVIDAIRPHIEKLFNDFV